MSPSAYTRENVAASLLSRSTSRPTTAAESVVAAAEKSTELAALVGIDPGGLLRAASELERIPAHQRGPLHGVPIGVKDNIDVLGLATTAGCPAMQQTPSPADAPVVSRLRAAGALIAAKTTMHELGLGVTSVNRWSGAVRNPHNPALVAGGSSGGSAAAVAAGIVPLALGTDTGGSIRIPAALCGVVGFRPTNGRWPLDGVVPVSLTRDTVGPIARSVAACALADAVLCGPRPPLAPRPYPIRVGVPRQLWAGIDSVVLASARSVLDKASAGVVQIQETDLPVDLGCLLAYGLVIALAENLRSIEHYHRCAGHEFDAQSFVDRVRSPDVREVLEELVADGGPSAESYSEALHSRDRDRQALAAWFAQCGIDVLCFPAVAGPAVPVSDSLHIELAGESVRVFDAYTRQPALASVLGFPAITIPTDRDPKDMPVGLELVGRAGDDKALLDVAERVEALT